MQAVVMRNGELVVDEVGLPDPFDHQVVIDTVACGICGSDLHCLRHAEQFVETSREGGMDVFVFDTDADLVMGHELAGRVARPAADGSGPAEGALVAVMPGLTVPGRGTMSIGFSNSHPGGYAEQFIADARGCVPIPEHLDPTRAALTEPLAVGLHAVNSAGSDLPGGAVVLGCGPVGLTVVSWLAARGVSPLIAADFSSGRCDLARTLGAEVAVDPRTLPAIEAWRESGGVDGEPPVIFECVGVPGMIDQAISMAPWRSRIVVVGLCMEPDTFRPTMAINRHVSLQFVLGWTPKEFRASLDAIATGAVDVEPMVTGTVELAGVPGAFEELASPVEHAKILVVPGSGS
jgi:threonine dehydrogenase-like Zn-dependent dehydrogenase